MFGRFRNWDSVIDWSLGIGIWSLTQLNGALRQFFSKN